MKSIFVGTSECPMVGTGSVNCPSNSTFYIFIFLPNSANQTAIRNVLSYKLKTRWRNKIILVRIT